MILKNRKRIFGKKGEFLIRKWVVAFFIFSAVFALLYASSTNLFANYDRDDLVNENYLDKYNQFSNQTAGYRSLFRDMSDESSGVLDILFGETGVFRALFDLIRITFGSVGTLDTMTEDFMTDFGVPEEIANIVFPLLSAILIALLIFAIISSVNRGSKL